MGDDDTIIPFWLGSTDLPAPCPCGKGIEEEMTLIKGPQGLWRMYHEDCLQMAAEEYGVEDDDE